QYTRNMVTGASTANAALVLIDARHGVTQQTKRHAFIASLLQIQHMIVCVNKMDLVGYDKTVFNGIIDQFEEFSSKLYVKDVRYIPISALKGDNVVDRSINMQWYQGAPLLYTLEKLHISSDINKIDARFPIQTVLRPQTEGHLDYRGYAGRVASGIFRPGDEITVLPSNLQSTIKTIDTEKGPLKEAHAPMSVSITLNDAIAVGRGDMIVKRKNRPAVKQEFDAMLCWLHGQPAVLRGKYTILHACNQQKAILKSVFYKIDINTYNRNENDKTLAINDIARVTLRTAKPLMVDEYRHNRTTGSFILIDENTHETLAAGMIV
ncbi:MAG: sulfate adenylyltransferase subunit 1, partial [Marinirhabdus sp.]